jgi:hypothetical protein
VRRRIHSSSQLLQQRDGHDHRIRRLLLLLVLACG